MKIMNIAMPSVLAMSLLGGCVMQPEEGQVDEADAEQTAQADVSDPAASDPAALARPLDGRAAAAAEAKVLGLDTTVPTSLAAWYSGSLAPGATQSWTWNNASPTAAYQVALSPVGASTASSCTFEVIRTSDVQKYGGEREFHFQIKNTGALTCGTNILLESKQRFATWATGGIEAGASKSWTWNNANPLNAAHIVGVSPSGATSSHPCELELVRTWYVQQPGGEREFKFTVKNVGGIACQGDVQLALTTSAASSWSTGALNPGASQSWVWNNANPLDRVYVPGLAPGGASGLTACQLEVTQSYYRQVIDSDGTPERKLYLTVKNIGSLACFGTVLLNYMD